MIQYPLVSPAGTAAIVRAHPDVLSARKGSLSSETVLGNVVEVLVVPLWSDNAMGKNGQLPRGTLGNHETLPQAVERVLGFEPDTLFPVGADFPDPTEFPNHYWKTTTVLVLGATFSDQSRLESLDDPTPDEQKYIQAAIELRNASLMQLGNTTILSASGPDANLELSADNPPQSVDFEPVSGVRISAFGTAEATVVMGAGQEMPEIPSAETTDRAGKPISGFQVVMYMTEYDADVVADFIAEHEMQLWSLMRGIPSAYGELTGVQLVKHFGDGESPIPLKFGRTGGATFYGQEEGLFYMTRERAGWGQRKISTAGGAVEPRQTPVTAALREAQEELLLSEEPQFIEMLAIKINPMYSGKTWLAMPDINVVFSGPVALPAMEDAPPSGRGGRFKDGHELAYVQGMPREFLAVGADPDRADDKGVDLTEFTKGLDAPLVPASNTWRVINSIVSKSEGNFDDANLSEFFFAALH